MIDDFNANADTTLAHANRGDFVRELQELINGYSLENGSDTPDYILANYMKECLCAFERATKDRDAWRGHTHCEHVGNIAP